MKSSRRGYLGALAAQIAAPAIPTALTPAVAVAETSALLKAGADFDGDVGSYARAQPTTEGGHLTKIIVQPRYRHVTVMPVMVFVGMSHTQRSDGDEALNRILGKFHQPASMEALLA